MGAPIFAVATRGRTALDDLFARRPEFSGAFVAAYIAAIERTDPVLVELCRLRMASILGSPFDPPLRLRAARSAGLAEDKISELAHWPSSPAFDERERASVQFAEAFVIDAAGITNADVAALLEHLSGDEVLWLTTAINYVDGLQRLCALLKIGGDGVPAGLPIFTTVERSE